MENSPFWLAEPSDPVLSARIAGDADVAVVGGGITGCSCALTFAEAGRKVRLFEALGDPEERDPLGHNLIPDVE
jgi:NADPH-dependent 2,4-dienoyl-CoA reductase/sulfur reductase-like enzyme